MIVVPSYGRLGCSLVQRCGGYTQRSHTSQGEPNGKTISARQLDRQMIHHHYLMLGLDLVVSTIIMYFVMFTMNWSFGDFFNNLNMFYMALMMATPMGTLMLLMMHTMYPNDRLNLLLHALFVLLFIVALLGVRAQGLIGDRQFVRSMIPHHSGTSHV